MGKLHGKVAVVTGGSTGIGFATAKRFVDEGAFVFITGRRQKELDEAVKAIGSNVVGVRGDVSKLRGPRSPLRNREGEGKDRCPSRQRRHRRIRSLGNPYGGAFRQALRSQREGHRVYGAKSPDADEAGGSIVLIGSVASVKGTPAFGTYGATKAAVRNLVRTWTMELKDRRIRSNVLSPGPIKTPLVDLQPPEAIARILTTIPMGRMGEPDEVAKAAVFLASDEIPALSRASNYSSMAAEVKFDQGKRGQLYGGWRCVRSRRRLSRAMAGCGRSNCPSRNRQRTGAMVERVLSAERGDAARMPCAI